MIFSKVFKEGEHVFGIYESDTTSLTIHYINRGANPIADTSRSHLDVEQMFQAMELLERRKGRK